MIARRLLISSLMLLAVACEQRQTTESSPVGGFVGFHSDGEGTVRGAAFLGLTIESDELTRQLSWQRDLADGECHRYAPDEQRINWAGGWVSPRDLPGFGEDAGRLHLTGESGEVELAWGLIGGILPIPYSGELTDPDFVQPDGLYTFSATGGTAIAPFAVPLPFPESMIVVAPDPNAPLTVDRGLALPLGWVPGTGDPVFAEIEDVVCRFEDDGAAEIPAAILESLDPGTFTLVLFRYRVWYFEIPEVTLPIPIVIAEVRERTGLLR